MKNKIISVSAPGKLMLFGEHSVVYGRPCIVTAVNQRIFVKIVKTKGDSILINAPEVNVKNYSIKVSNLGKIDYPKDIKFVLKSVENFFKKYKVSSGLKIFTHSQFSSLFGFGSSSAITVCMVKGLSKIFDIQVYNKALFDIAYKTVLDVQGVGSGFDLAAAVWGGTLYFVGGGKKIVPLNVKPFKLIVGYTGIKADTATLIKNVADLYKKNKTEVEGIFKSIDKIVEKAKINLQKGNYRVLGDLMIKDQGFLNSLGVSSTKLDNLISAANTSGAFGAKLSGAGGGDCMIAFVDKKNKNNVMNEIVKKGGIIIDVKTGAEGVRVERI